jgi:hypothetical protein
MHSSMVPDLRWPAGPYAPYVPAVHADSRGRRSDPDVTSVLPVIYGLIDPRSAEAASTIEALDALWSPTGRGGYARYPIESDPDSPGPWPFATAFAAAAEIEAGLGERAARSIDWLLDAAGPGGCWFEYYGERNPPAPPVGIVAWAWAQFVILVVRHLLGVRIEDDHVTIRPRMTGLHVTLPFGSSQLVIAVEGLGAVRLDGVPCERGEAVTLPLPLRADHRVEFESP